MGVKPPFKIAGLQPRTVLGQPSCRRCGKMTGLSPVGKDIDGAPLYECEDMPVDQITPAFNACMALPLDGEATPTTRTEAQCMTDLQRIERVMQEYRCNREDAERYLDLREEGYGQHQAAVMTGLADPHDPEEQ